MDNLKTNNRSNPFGDQTDPRAIAGAKLLADTIGLLSTSLTPAQVDVVMRELLGVAEGDGAILLAYVKTAYVENSMYRPGADVPAVAAAAARAYAAIWQWAETTQREHQAKLFDVPPDVELVASQRMARALDGYGAGIVAFLDAMRLSADEASRRAVARMAKEAADSSPTMDPRLRGILHGFAAEMQPVEVTAATVILAHIERARSQALGIASMLLGPRAA